MLSHIRIDGLKIGHGFGHRFIGQNLRIQWIPLKKIKKTLEN